jgi:hypothetical protein
MKLISTLIGMAAAGTLGYLVEPHLRFELTGKSPNTVRADSKIHQRADGALEIDLGALSPEDLPKQVLLMSAAKVSDPATNLTMTIDAGNRVTLVRIEGTNVIISPGPGAFVGTVPIQETDLLQQIAANPPAPTAPPEVKLAEPPIAPAPIPEPIPAPEPTPTPAPIPEPIPAPDPAPAPVPETVPAPQPAPTTASGPTDAVKLMQESVRAGQIKEFTFDQVLAWKAEPDETIDGETYQTGLASYKAETIFGVKTIQAKALIKDGKVQRWIWPKSGMEIK